MKISVAKIPLFTKEQITEKTLEIYWRVVDSFYQILIICPDKSITKIPGIVGEQVVVNVLSR